MNELIAFNNDQMTVSARDLHEKLGMERRFSSWFESYSNGFVEGVDFTSVRRRTVVNNGAERELQDYDMSVDMAKNICIMSKTEKGKECRRYLIELEKAWNSPAQVMARALKIAQDTIDFLQTEIEGKSRVITELQPKATYYDLVLKSQSTLTTTEIAKDYGMSAVAFNKILKDQHIQYKQSGRWFLYSEYDGKGYVSSSTYLYGEEENCTRSSMVWTQAGRLFLYETLKKVGIVPEIEK